MSVLSIAGRWNPALCPNSCVWGRSRNDVVNVSPHSRTESVIRRGRPLWTASATWTMLPEQMAEFRYAIDTLQGARGSVVLWDFKNPWPRDYAKALAAQAGGIEIDPIVPILWQGPSSDHPWENGGLDFYWFDPSAAVLGQKSILAKFPASAAGMVLRRGEFIQLKRRLYILANDVTVLGAPGYDVVALTTPILDNLVVGDECRIVEAGCEMRLDGQQDWSGQKGANDGFETITLKFIETSRNYGVDGLTFAT